MKYYVRFDSDDVNYLIMTFDQKKRIPFLIEGSGKISEYYKI